ncbi:MAG: hypothetical protein AAFW46_17870 [Pseudomonadota bacterium]
MAEQPRTTDPKTAATIHNEKSKLRASFLNGLGIATVALGVARPLFSNAPMTREQIYLMLGALVVGALFHVEGRRGLNRMRKED